MADGKGPDTLVDDEAGQNDTELTPEQILQKERDRLEMKMRSKVAKARTEARAEALAEAEEQQKRANMEEVDRLKAEKVDLEAEVAALKEQLAQRDKAVARAEYISANAGDLPAAYQALVRGETEEELVESLAAARAQFEADFKARTGSKPPNTGSAAKPAKPQELEVNPYRKEQWNLTQQGRLEADDPTKAARLKAEAGIA